MRRSIAALTAIAVVSAVAVTGCASGPNGDAVAAAHTYAQKLAAWADELEAAAEKARTATPAERRAAEGELPWEEIGLGEALAGAPKLADVPGAEFTAAYVRAEEVEARVDTAVAELSALEPEVFANREAATAAYDVVADLYYDTTAADDVLRVEAAGTFDLEDAERGKVLRELWIEFYDARSGFLQTAIDAAPAIEHDDVPHSASVTAFMIDWYTEEKAYNEAAAATIKKLTHVSSGFDTVWNYGNLNTVLDAGMTYAAPLRAGYVAQISALSDALGDGADVFTNADLPAPGDPYRQVLIDTYLPLHEEVSSAVTADRMWMLWRIRELEDTPDEVYLAARVTLQEELIRGSIGYSRGDFRPGKTRLDALAEEYEDAFQPWDVDEAALAKISEVGLVADLLMSHPTMPEMETAFDALVAAYTQFDEELATIIEEYPDDYDRIQLMNGYNVVVRKDVGAALAPVEALFDDDATFQAAQAAAIEATAPQAWNYGEEKTPDPVVTPSPTTTPEG